MSEQPQKLSKAARLWKAGKQQDPVLPAVADVPTATEAERAIASIALNFPNEFVSLCADKGFDISDIFHPLSKRVCEIVLELSAKNSTCEIRVVFERCREFIPDLQFYDLSELYQLCAIFSALPEFIKIVSHTAKRRALQQVLAQASHDIGVSDIGTPELIASVAMKAEEIGRQLSPPKQMDTKALLMSAIERYEKGQDASSVIRTGYQSLDNITPIRAGDFLVIGGETKAGKTMLALNIIANLILEHEANKSNSTHN
jgi:replicative DNA helicase